MANNEKMPGTEAQEAVEKSAPVTPQFGGVPGGLDMGNPAAQQALNEYGRSAGYIARSSIMGAAAGATAGQNAAHPLTAFIQGMGAGVQMNAQLYEQKRAQIQSVVDATPFASTHPELAAPGKPYELLGGMPTALAMKVLQQAAIDTNKVLQEHKAKSEEMALGAEMERRNKLFEMSFKGKDPISIKDQISIAKDFEGLTAVKDYMVVKPAYEAVIGATGAAGDKTMLVNFARMLNPTIRVNEQTMDAVDVSSLFDRHTAGLWNKIAKGEELSPEERVKIRTEATRLYNLKEKDYSAVSHLWKEKASEAGYDPRVIGSSFGKAKLQMTKTGEMVYVTKGPDGKYYEVGAD